jgi:hypothetical protein
MMVAVSDQTHLTPLASRHTFPPSYPSRPGGTYVWIALARLLALAATVVLAPACAEKHWIKAGATEEDFNRDSYECAMSTTEQAFTWRPPIAGGPRFGTEVNKDLYRLCMTRRGYRRVEGGQWIGVRD